VLGEAENPFVLHDQPQPLSPLVGTPVVKNEKNKEAVGIGARLGQVLQKTNSTPRL
jgi:hypothetical protein